MQRRWEKRETKKIGGRGQRGSLIQTRKWMWRPNSPTLNHVYTHKYMHPHCSPNPQPRNLRMAQQGAARRRNSLSSDLTLRI